MAQAAQQLRFDVIAQGASAIVKMALDMQLSNEEAQEAMNLARQELGLRYMAERNAAPPAKG